jgi:hypothetical protein
MPPSFPLPAVLADSAHLEGSNGNYRGAMALFRGAMAITGEQWHFQGSVCAHLPFPAVMLHRPILLLLLLLLQRIPSSVFSVQFFLELKKAKWTDHLSNIV